MRTHCVIDDFVVLRTVPVPYGLPYSTSMEEPIDNI